jgi:hypothetical protein
MLFLAHNTVKSSVFVDRYLLWFQLYDILDRKSYRVSEKVNKQELREGVGKDEWEVN